MYAIVSNGVEIAMCDAPNYVKRTKDGIWINTKMYEADAVAVNGVIYNMPGKNVFEGAPEAVVVERDAGERAFESMQAIAENKENAAMIEDALCEIDAAGFENIATIEDALCEIDMMNGGN